MEPVTSNVESVDLTAAIETEKDEFIIDKDKLKLIAEVQEKLLDLFNVTVTFGDSFDDDDVGNKQWVEVEGEMENRKQAKEYVQTLCNPVEVQQMKYPKELQSVLKNPVTYGRVEKQSRAVVRFEQPGEVTIYGNDRLAVTLAYSALEDIISQHIEEETWDPESTIPGKRRSQASSRLDEELKRRLSTEDGNSVDEDDLTSMNNAIKRTILDVLHSRKGDIEPLESYGIKPHGVVAGGSTDSGYISLHGANRMEVGTSLGEAAKQLGQIQLEPAAVQSNNINNSGCQAAASSTVTASESPDSDKVKYLRDWALSKGHKEDKIQLVFDKHGYDLHFQTFYRALNNISNTSNTDAGPSVSGISGGATKTETVASSETGIEDESVNKVDEPATSKQMVSYIARLSRDHDEEEEHLSREELMERNAERQRLLIKIFEKRKHKDSTSESEIVQISDEEDTKVEEDSVDHPYQTNRYKGKHYRGAQNKQQQQQQHHQPTNHRSRSPVNHHHDTTYNPAVKNFMQGRSPSPKRYRGQNYNPNTAGHQTGRRQEEASSLRPAIAVKTDKRYIVIDGSNVAFTHGNGQIFSCRGIELCINYFLKKGHTEVTAFVPQWRTRNLHRDYPISDQPLLDELKKRGYLVFTPSRRVPGKNIVCYDDRYVIRLAEETEGIVVSNDNYRDLWSEKVEWRPIIENRLLMFSFVGDIFMPPDDPLGKDGPTLDQFLHKGNYTAGNWGGDFRQPYHQQHHQQQHQQQHEQHHQQQLQRHQQQQQSQSSPVQSLMGPPPTVPAWNNRPWLNQPKQQNQFTGPRPNQGRNNQQRFQGQPQHYGQAQAYNHSHNNQNRQGGQQQRSRGNDSTDGSDWQQVGKRQNERSKKPARDPKVTDALREQLLGIFSENEDAVRTVLRLNPGETDLNTLSTYLLNYMDNRK